MQCVAVYCSPLQWVVVCCRGKAVTHSTWAATQSRLDVAVCCSVSQSVAVGCGVLQWTSSHSTWAATQSHELVRIQHGLRRSLVWCHLGLFHMSLWLTWWFYSCGDWICISLKFFEKEFAHTHAWFFNANFVFLFHTFCVCPPPHLHLVCLILLLCFTLSTMGYWDIHCFELVLVRNVFVCLYLLFLTVVFATLSKVSWHQVASDIMCLIIQFAWWRIEFLLKTGIECPLD